MALALACHDGRRREQSPAAWSRPWWWGRRVHRRRLPGLHQLIHCALLVSSPWVTCSPTSRSTSETCPRTSGPRSWSASRGWCPSASCCPHAAASRTRWRSASSRPDPPVVGLSRSLHGTTAFNMCVLNYIATG
ncbi:hypothetical protein PVAP13_2KG422705 [Panicum virgatum]|uniref:Uncharacterized protein n=1 Tax=Panicum virgatum TaxID=38727 RepID=A0A8T0WCY8_PANVG|nr:hypothetical protein PVAP13_2KG422705 [Panicum virgatum]